MKSKDIKNPSIIKVLKLYSNYLKSKGPLEPLKKSVQPLSLDDQLETINPYYVRNEYMIYDRC